MVKPITAHEIKRYLLNPIFYLGAILIFINIYSNTKPYLKIKYFHNQQQIEKAYGKDTDVDDADIMQGYVPTTDSEKDTIGWKHVYKNMVKGLAMNPEKVNEIIKNLKSKNMSINELSKYMQKTYGYYNIKYEFNEPTKKANIKEANKYINDSLKKETYTSYFSRKYTDYLSVGIIAYATILLAFLYLSDMKRDMYELLHTKAIKAWQYVIGKILGGVCSILIVVFVLTAIFDVLAMKHGISCGYSVDFLDIWKAIVLYVLPNIIIVVSIYTFIATIFKNPLPAVPILLAYMLYSNLGIFVKDNFKYVVKPVVILVRFPQMFFETTVTTQLVINQFFLLIASIIFILTSINVWKRRKVL